MKSNPKYWLAAACFSAAVSALVLSAREMPASPAAPVAQARKPDGTPVPIGYWLVVSPTWKKLHMPQFVGPFFGAHGDGESVCRSNIQRLQSALAQMGRRKAEIDCVGLPMENFAQETAQ
jgi:hypothetical protein